MLFAARVSRVLLLALLAGLSVAAASCDEYIVDSETTVPPRVTGFLLEPDSLDLTDAGDTAVAAVGARAGREVDSVRVRFRSPSGELQRACVARTPVSGDATDGTWSCALALDRADPAGRWQVAALDVIGGGDVVLDVDSAALAEAGYPRALDVTRRPLTLEAVAVERDTVSAYRDTARVAVRATLSGPRLDSATTRLARGEVTVGCTATEPATGSRGDGEWACDVVFPQGALPGDWPVSEVRAYPAGLAAASFGADTLAALGAPDVTVATPPVSFVVVTAPRDTLRAPGDTTRASATAYDELERVVEGVTFDWSSTDSSVVTVDGQGLVTARGEGSAWVRAATSGVADSTRLTVRFRSRIDSVAIAPAADTILDRGDTTRFAFTAWDTTGAALDTGAVWWVGDTTVATVDPAGLVTARTGGETTVFAALEEDTATAAIRVTPIAFITMAPYGTTYRAVADTFRYDVTFYGRFERIIDGVEAGWSSSDTTVATVDATGRVVPLQPGTTTVTVAAEDSTESRTVQVVDVAAIDVTPDPFAFDTIGQVEQFRATATAPSGDTVQVAVTWTSTDTTVVSAVPGGYVTAEGRGSAAVRATAGAVSGQADVTVAAVDSVAISPAADTILDRGDTTRLTFRTFTATGAESDEPADAWWSSDTTVATVDSTGLVTSVAGGTATIGAALGGDTATASIYVPPVDFLVVSPYADTLYSAGDTTQYTATAFTRFERVIGGVEIAWTSTDPAVATIDSTGLATAVAPDSTDIVATAEGVSTARPLWVVTVDSVAVSPSSYYFEFLGHELQFTATALGPAGDTINADVAWSSSDTTIVTINSSGLARAVGHGEAEIRARVGAVQGVAPVVSDVVTEIIVTPSVDTLTAVGETTQYIATAYSGEFIVENVDFTWSTGSTAVATVDSTGQVTAVDSGSTQVTARALYDQGSATVEVVTLPAQFTLQELGWLGAGPGPRDVALAVSPYGQAAGMARNDAGDDVPFWWNADQGMLEIPTLGSADSTYGAAYDMNATTFAIVGESTHESGTIQAFYFIPHDSLVAIGDLEGLGSRARAVNDSMAIVGGSMTSSGQEHAFLWTEEGGMRDLGTLGGAQSMAMDISNDGIVVGHSWVDTDQAHAFAWTADGGMIDLGTLGGATSYATAINPEGVVAGHAEDADGNMRAVVWLPPYDGAPVELGTLGGARSFARDLSRDRAVGESETETGELVPTVYFGEGGLTAVEVEGAIVEALRAVNANGQMAGAATIDGVRRAVRIDANY